jgi:hypothetical protein
MKNVNLVVSPDKKTATITIDLSGDFGKSSTGKSIKVASSDGNVAIPGTDLKLGLNVYKPL